MGDGALASGLNAVAIGAGATATGSIAAGTGAFASNGGAAFGDFARATGYVSSALGPNTSAEYDGSVAIGADSTGAGAVAMLENEIMIGTELHTLTAPGIDSKLSRLRQSGRLEIVTSDAGGHLATDGGQVFDRLDEHEAGIALAYSMENPTLGEDDRFGVATAWGTFEGAQAFSVSALGIVAKDVLFKGDSVGLFGSVGGGFVDEARGDNIVGGRVGAQWTY